MKTNRFLKYLTIVALCGAGIVVGTALAGGGFPDPSIPGTEPINVAGPQTGPGDEQLLDSAKRFINYLLNLLGLIALVIILYGGFQMVTAAGKEDQYKKGFTILKQAAIGLAFIALSWIVVRFIFFVIGFIVS